MNLIDMKTVIFSYLVSNVLGTGVVTLLWLQNRQRFAGLGLWLADFAMQTVALLLIALRGVVPDWMSMIASNTLLIGGTILLYIGLEHFVGHLGTQVHNYALLAVFIVVQAYFVFLQPNLAARNINISVGVLAICFQCAWLMLRRAGTDMLPMTRGVGFVFAGYCLVSVARIIVDTVAPPGHDFFKESGPFDTLLILTYQMLFIVLTFSLFLMINRRLFLELQTQQEKLQGSEARYRQLVELSPDAIVVHRDGNIAFVNPAAVTLMGATSQDELLGKAVIEFVHPDYRDLAQKRTEDTITKGGTAPMLEEKFVRLDGAIIDVEATTGRLEYQGRPALQTIVRNITQRKQAEEALRESEANFREVFDNTAHGIFIVEVTEDGNFRIGNSNRAEEIATTIRKEDVQGKLLEKAFSADTAQALHANYSHCLEAGVPIAYEEEVNLPVGRRFYYTTLAPVRDASGRFYRIIGSTLEITDRMRAEEIIRLRLRLFEFAAGHSLEELMQKALDEIGQITDSPIGFYHFVEADQNTLSLQAWSTRTLQEFCKAEGKGLHYSLDEAGVWVDCVRQRKPVIHNDYAALLHRKGMPAGHAEVKRELVVPTMREGRIVSILGVGNKPSDYDEKDIELVAYVADVIWNIVERKRAEAQLQEYQRRLETQNLELRKLSLAIEQSGSTIVITDITGAIQYANPPFEETTGYTVHEALGQNPRILKSGKQSADFYQVLWDTITSGRIWHGELHNKRKDGTLYWESATIAPVQDAAGHITNYIAIKEDVTARKQIEEELRQFNAELQTRNEELDAFAHTVAHDLKNPVSLVITSAELLLDAEYPLNDEERKRTTLSIARAGRKMNSIIQELLLLSQVRKTEVAVRPLDMHSIAQEALLRLQEMLANYQVELAVPAASEWPSAVGYGPWTEEVWVNYLSNAIKYGAPEGVPPHVELGAELQPDGMARFWVRDNGPGLTPEAQSRLFTPFTRLDQVHTQGHGLGLSIVRRIVEKLGGQVAVESQLGQGSTFVFTLPAG